MDTQKTGLFICLLRKQKGLTQRQLAEEIGVTDKAVSRWETGNGFPDVGLLEPLAAALGTSVSELMAGEPLTAEEKAEQSDGAILEALRYTKGMGEKTIAVLLTIAGIFLLMSPLFTAGLRPTLPLIGLALLVAALVVCTGKLSFRKLFHFNIRGISPKSARIGSLACLAAALMLELLPWGVVMFFARPPEEGPPWRETCSYFNMLPFGYGNIFPLLTGILTVALLAFGLLQLRRRSQKLASFLFIANIAALVFTVLPWLLFGLHTLSPVGTGVLLCLLLSTCFTALANREH